MPPKFRFVAVSLFAFSLATVAQQPSDLKLDINSSNRTIAVSATGRVTVDPDVAILHVGFETKPEDSKSAYADGARISNAIVAAIKGAGIPDASIRSEFQRLEPVDVKNHRFKLTQSWTVKVPPPRACEVLDLAVDAGATDSGDIEWTVEDIHALEDQALKQAAERARSDAGVIAAAADAKLGSLLFATNQIAEIRASFGAYANDSVQYEKRRVEAPALPLSIEPRKVVREATVYMVFSIQ
ncbi:MAG TPA: SIMPL domain-containing protein [Terracidiphilus sp.]|nr:SIMPL domain-containing protein [Terracidiphilus sp.]